MYPKLEELSLNAWPALETMVYDGWLLRFADGYTKRANSVCALYPSTEALESKIAACEAYYQGKGLPTIFKMTPFAEPHDLDELLEAKGYVAQAFTSMQAVSLDKVAAPSLHLARFDEYGTEEWRDAYCRLSHQGEKAKETMTKTLGNIIPPACYASLYVDNKIVACGLGVVEREYIGLFDIVTDQAYRNQGLGEQLVLNLLQWGQEKGAKYSYLQVLKDNQPALRLYEKIGYHEQYVHWYRIKE
ncbi:GNAT family N-acetyltransferase [uncultured Brevibacillus sp.]|uniref:GNAT family N-acetyltransferase n=1 Tax=uncultured Brevibacillus sp. TaxID=169970 RepID=UPI002598117A|nr:GNAT family N-acetyltransferase [uncultured Brevibacillus sp.]